MLRKLLPAALRSRLRYLYNRYLAIFFIIKIQRVNPVIVYTMGKVGSSSIGASLKKQLRHFHVHTFMPERIERQRAKEDLLYLHQWEQIRKLVVEAKRPARFISAVRNPIDRNLSTFFERYEYYTGAKFAQSQLKLDELIQIFHEQFEHERPLTWFDEELKSFLGVDVYQYPFPHEQGYLRMQAGNAEILILKLETPDSIKEKALGEFLHIPNFVLKRDNIAEDKSYAAIYKAFKQQIILSEGYINQMLDSALAQHFYTPEEIATSRQKWMARLQTANAK